MLKTTFKHTLDIHDIYSQFTLRIKKGDTSGRLIISLSELGKPFYIPEGCYAILAGIKKDGSLLYNECTIEENTIVYHMTEQTTSTVGFIKCDIEVYDSHDQKLLSPSFIIEVCDSAFSQEEIENSNEFLSLSSLISQTNKLINDVTSKLDNGEFIGPKGEQGLKGDAGSIKFLPVVELPTENIDETAMYLVPIADSEGENEFIEYVYINSKWEKIGVVKVEVDPSEYVKFTDFATENKAGVVKNYYNKWSSGIEFLTDGSIKTACASEVDIKAKVNDTMPIVSKNLDKAVKVGVTTNTETLTDEEKASACEWLGAIKQNNSVSEFKQAYVKTQDGSLLMVDLSDNTRGASIVVRRGTGHIFVPLIPTDNNAATSKNYVDSIGSNWENINISADNIKINLTTDISTRPDVNLAGFKMRYNPTLRLLNLTGRVSLYSTIAWTAAPKFSFDYNYVIAYLQNIIQNTPACPVQLITVDKSSNGTFNEGAYITLNDTTFSITAYETFNTYREAGTKVFQFSTFIPY